MRPVLFCLVLCSVAQGSLCARQTHRLKRVPQAPEIPPCSAASVLRAVRRGVAFLLSHQNPDGSWGSARNTKGLNVYAPVPGAHHAFRCAVTALCTMALCEVGGEGAAVAKAIERAKAFLRERLPHVKRATPDTIYNVWAHAYGLQALVRLLKRSPGSDEKEALRALIRSQIDMLRRYECLGGGWAYYDFFAHTPHPSGTSPSFVTACVLVALKEVEAAGIAVPEAMVRGSLRCLLRQRKPDGSFLYGEYLWWRPMRGVNRPAGSLGRSQACNLALRLWGRPEGNDAVLAAWLERLFARNGWLSIGRKRPIPHESWFQVAGYFFYFGHYYAARCIEVLPVEKRPRFAALLAQVLLGLQERDGSWWDFPFYDYHKQYGTAFALSALKVRSFAPSARL